MKLEYSISTIMCILWSLWYAKIETILLPASNKSIFLFPKPSIYHFFMLMLVIIMAWYPFIDDAIKKKNRLASLFYGIGNIALMTFVEDRLYFVWLGRFIRPDEWTCAGCYVQLSWGDCIPCWYFISISLMFLFYVLSINRIRYKLAKYI